MSTARRRRRGDRPPTMGEDGLHADPTRNGLTAPEEIGAARSLVHAYRTHGHMAARLDPLGSDPIGDPALDPAYHGLADDALDRISASTLDLFVPGETLADALPRLRETYAGPIAYQIEHLSGHRQRLWLREAIESGAYTQPLPPDERRHILDRLLRVETFEALSPSRVPRREAVLDRGPRRDGADARRDDHARRAGRHRGGRARHGAPRPSQRARARAAAQLLVDHLGVRGPAGRGHPRGAARGRRRRRQVPPRRTLLAGDRRGRARGRRGARGAAPHRHLAAAQPLAPRVREPRRERPRARAADRPGAQRRAGRHEPRARDLDPRRRGLPRPGRRGRDAQPAVARRLPRRRHAARDREQPGRLHDGRARLALDALLVRPRQGLRHPDHPRQRRRRRRLPQRGAPRDGVPRALRARRADRPGRLPALRSQRDRRARLHAAAAGRAHQGAPLGRHALRAAPDRRRPDRRGRRRDPPRADAGAARPRPPSGRGWRAVRAQVRRPRGPRPRPGRRAATDQRGTRRALRRAARDA